MIQAMKLANELGAERSPIMLLSGGASAVGVTAPGMAAPGALEVYDAQGQLVLRYEPEVGQVQLGFSAATLTVDSQTGDTRICAPGKLTLQGKDVEVVGQRSVSVGVRTAMGQVGAQLMLGAQRLALLSKRFDLRAEREHREVQHASLNATTLSVKVEQLSQKADRLETVASMMLTKAKEAFTYVEGESRVEAKRATWKVAETLWFRSKRAFLRSDKDVNIDGQKVNLG